MLSADPKSLKTENLLNRLINEESFHPYCSPPAASQLMQEWSHSCPAEESFLHFHALEHTPCLNYTFPIFAFPTAVQAFTTPAA